MVLEYDDALDLFVCQEETQICQAGSSTQITCDAPLTPANDSWGLYEDNCFRKDGSPTYYDQSCCYLTQINDFIIYQWEEEQGVRIY